MKGIFLRCYRYLGWWIILLSINSRLTYNTNTRLQYLATTTTTIFFSADSNLSYFLQTILIVRNTCVNEATWKMTCLSCLLAVLIIIISTHNAYIVQEEVAVVASPPPIGAPIHDAAHLSRVQIKWCTCICICSFLFEKIFFKKVAGTVPPKHYGGMAVVTGMHAV